jgi:hypothetical protein
MIFKLKFGGGNLFSLAMTSTIEGNDSVGSLLTPLLKKVTPKNVMEVEDQYKSEFKANNKTQRKLKQPHVVNGNSNFSKRGITKNDLPFIKRIGHGHQERKLNGNVQSILGKWQWPTRRKTFKAIKSQSKLYQPIRTPHNTIPQGHVWPKII